MNDRYYFVCYCVHCCDMLSILDSTFVHCFSSANWLEIETLVEILVEEFPHPRR